MFKEHHNHCIKEARAAKARLHVPKRMHSIVPELVRAVQIACIQVVELYGSELWWNPKEIGRREVFQHLPNWQPWSILGTLPTTPLGPLMRDPGQTPAPVALDSRQQQCMVRHASACECLKQKDRYNHPRTGAPICRVIKNEHDRGREAETMHRLLPDKELAVEMVKLSDNTATREKRISERERGWPRLVQGFG